MCNIINLRNEQSEQLVVTTKLNSPIKGITCLKLLPIPLLIVTIDVIVDIIIEHVVTPSLMVNNKVESLKK